MENPLPIYIMGDGRSGSTVLATLLGNHPRITTVGSPPPHAATGCS